MPIEQHYSNEYWLEIVLNQTDKSGKVKRTEKSFKSGFDAWSWYQRMRPSFAKKKSSNQPEKDKKGKKKGVSKEEGLVQSDGFASYGGEQEEQPKS